MQPKLLLIDESHAYQEVLRIRLEAIGYQVRSPQSSEEIKELSAQRWDVIISDSQFQKCDTEKLLEMLRPNVNTVFFYTEKNAQELADSLKKRGVKDVFPKLRRGDLLKAVQALLPNSAMPAPSEPAAAAPSGKSQRFLMVDDSPTIRKFVRAILEKGFPGSQVYEAEDGKTAMHELAGQKMDLIVTDMQMPGVDGQSFIKTLQRNSLLNKKPIVILSGMVTQEMQKEFGTIPTIRILSKPADPGKIIETVRGLLTF